MSPDTQPTTIEPGNGPYPHFIIRDTDNPRSCALITSVGGGIPRAVTLDGTQVFWDGPMHTQDAEGQRGMMRGNHNMLPPGSKNPEIRQHGVLQTINSDEWKIDQNQATFLLNYGATEEFPWSFAFEQTIRIEANKLIRTFRITNQSDGNMPIPFGLHDYFLVTRSRDKTLDETFDQLVVIDEDNGEKIIAIADYERPEEDQVQRFPLPRSILVIKNGEPNLRLSFDGPLFRENDYAIGSVNIWSDTINKRSRRTMSRNLLRQLEKKYQVKYPKWQKELINADLERRAYLCIEMTTDGMSPMKRSFDQLLQIAPGEIVEFEVIVEAL